MTHEHRQALLFGRFEVLEELGAGAFGRVLRCTDVESGEVVALKELHRFGADALLRFKREFRVIADVQHPNLVRLGELFEGEGQWGFSLEYVPGCDALSWVRQAEHDPRLHEARLRELLTSLVHALSAIHALGILHRDVKPANVRVTPTGRVVLLDLGLATHLARGRQVSEAAAVGTAAYMAPEQANGQRLTPAADWYSLGALFFEALTGRLPFEGTSMQILMAKNQTDPPAPSQLVADLPRDLEAVCMGLLATDVEDRLDGLGVLARIGKTTSALLPTGRTASAELFVGREDVLSELDRAFDRTANEGFGVMLLEGESGIGKTTVATRFADLLCERRPEVLALNGRCHAAEQVGYKAFDDAIDMLARFLKAQPSERTQAVLPPDAQHLAVLFPVLEGVPTIAQAVRRARIEKVERYPLFQAFLELLRRISRERPLLLVVDDLQWADESSFVLLRALLDSARPPRMLLLATVRPLDGLDDAIGEALRALTAHPRVERLPLGPLAEAETRTLIARLGQTSEDASLVLHLVRDAGGHPLFASELVRHAREGVQSGSKAGLDAAIYARVSRLALAPRLALELSAVASAPLPRSVLRDAVGVPAETLNETLSILRSQRLLHAVRRNATVVYHDRIREAVLRALPSDLLAAHHRSLAEAWEREPNAEPAHLALHWLGCGEAARAAPFLERAAKKAEQGGAFEGAIEHYRTLLGLSHVTRERAEDYALRLSLSDALASAGHCAESARVLLGALDGATEAEALELTIRAAQRLLQAAEVDEGLAAAEKAFSLMGSAWPKTRLGVIASIAWSRLCLARRGLEPRSDEVVTVSEKQRIELDALWRLQLPVVWADLLRSIDISSRHARLALACGDAKHAAFSLCGEAHSKSLQAAPREVVSKLFDSARSWRSRDDGPELEAYEEWTLGTHAHLSGRARDSQDHFERAERLFAESCPGAVWELSNARGSLLAMLHIRGRLRRHADLTQTWLDEADVRGDRFARTTYLAQGQGSLRHLLLDAPTRGLAELTDATAASQQGEVRIKEVVSTIVGGQLLLYPDAGDTQAFWAARWPRLERSLSFRVPALRDLLVSARLATCLAAAFDGEAGALAEVRRFARLQRKGRSAWNQHLGLLMQAQVAWLEGEREDAASLASKAASLLEDRGVDLFAPAAALMAARASGAPDTDDIEQRVLDWLASEGAVRPDRMLLFLLPAARSWR